MSRPNVSAARFAKRQAEVKGLLVEVNADLARLPDAVFLKLAPILTAAEKELERDLARWLRSVPDGDERFTAFQLRKALYQLRGSMAKVREAGLEMRAGLRRGATTAANLSTRHLEKELASFSFRFEGSLTPLPILEAASIVQGTLLDRFALRSSVWTKRARDGIRHQLSLGMVRGETVGQMTNRLLGRKARSFGPDASPESKAEEVSRVLWSRPNYEARRIVRTEVVESYNAVKDEQIRELAVEDPRFMKRWDAALDARTCADCEELDHVVVKPDEDFPGGVDHPPLHPNCRCVAVVWRSDWDEAGSVKKP